MSTIWIVGNQFQSHEYNLDCAKIVNQNHEYYLECNFSTKLTNVCTNWDHMFNPALKSMQWNRTRNTLFAMVERTTLKHLSHYIHGSSVLLNSLDFDFFLIRETCNLTWSEVLKTNSPFRNFIVFFVKMVWCKLQFKMVNFFRRL